MKKEKIDICLYQAKYFLRDILVKIPSISKLSPNLISLLAIIPGIAAAYFIFKSMWLATFLAIALRMTLNTLDGLIAEGFNKTSRLGAYLNKLPGEITDILIVIAFQPHVGWIWTITIVTLTSWVQMLGLLGLVAGGKTQAVGPCGQTDRLAIIGISSIFAIYQGNQVWLTMVPIICAGCAVTILLRVYRSIKEIKELK